jgi:hypothetical protein
MPSPDQVPQGVDELVSAVPSEEAAKLREEAGASGREGVENGVVEVGPLELLRVDVGTQIAPGHQPDPAVLGAEGARPKPCKLPLGTELVELRPLDTAQPRRKHPGLKLRPRYGTALQLGEGVEEPASSASGSLTIGHTAHPLRKEGRIDRRVDRLHLSPEARQGAPLDPTQHLPVAPLGLSTGKDALLDGTRGS